MSGEICVDTGLGCEIGRRKVNQDSVEAFSPSEAEDLRRSGRLLVVADGVGGASHGEVASQYATRKLLYEYYNRPEEEPGRRLERILSQVGGEIFQYSQSLGERMATTLVAAALIGRELTVASVGDSRAYLVRGGAVRRITRDHSAVGEAVRLGGLSEAEANRTIKNHLTRSLGGQPEVVPDIFREQLQDGDLLILCTDGVTRYLNQDAELMPLLGDGPTQSIVDRLIQWALWKGGVDNIGVCAAAVNPAWGVAEKAAPVRLGAGEKPPVAAGVRAVRPVIGAPRGLGSGAGDLALQQTEAPAQAGGGTVGAAAARRPVVARRGSKALLLGLSMGAIFLLTLLVGLAGGAALLRRTGGAPGATLASETPAGGAGGLASETPAGGAGGLASETPVGGAGGLASETPAGGAGGLASETPAGGAGSLASETPAGGAPTSEPPLNPTETIPAATVAPATVAPSTIAPPPEALPPSRAPALEAARQVCVIALDGPSLSWLYQQLNLQAAEVYYQCQEASGDACTVQVIPDPNQVGRGLRVAIPWDQAAEACAQGGGALVSQP